MSRDRRIQWIAGAVGLVLAIAGGGGPLRSQVPDGWYVTTHLKLCTDLPWLADGRILVINPETKGLVQVSGLPDELLSRPCQGWSQGAKGILVRPEDGAILVGETTTTGKTVDIFLLELDRFAVSGLTRFPVGTDIDEVGIIDQMEFLHDGRVLFSLTGLAPDIALGILDLSAADRATGRELRG